jgi:hypothetical protein
MGTNKRQNGYFIFLKSKKTVFRGAYKTSNRIYVLDGNVLLGGYMFTFAQVALLPCGYGILMINLSV